MGTVDRVLRALAGVVILWLYYQGILYGLSAIILFFVSIMFLITSMVGYCPVYALIGINSGGIKSGTKSHS